MKFIICIFIILFGTSHILAQEENNSDILKEESSWKRKPEPSTIILPDNQKYIKQLLGQIDILLKDSINHVKDIAELKGVMDAYKKVDSYQKKTIKLTQDTLKEVRVELTDVNKKLNTIEDSLKEHKIYKKNTKIELEFCKCTKLDPNINLIEIEFKLINYYDKAPIALRIEREDGDKSKNFIEIIGQSPKKDNLFFPKMQFNTLNTVTTTLIIAKGELILGALQDYEIIFYNYDLWDERTTNNKISIGEEPFEKLRKDCNK